MVVHVHLKNEFTEDEKYHNLMRWLKYEKPYIEDWKPSYFKLLIKIVKWL